MLRQISTIQGFLWQANPTLTYLDMYGNEIRDTNSAVTVLPEVWLLPLSQLTTIRAKARAVTIVFLVAMLMSCLTLLVRSMG